jgi:uncharacterized protein YecT (DUF1311 family)
MTKAFDAFVEQHTTYELDLSGTARNAFQFEEENVTRDAHAKDLMALLTGAWPPASAAQAKSADAALNAAYRKALATYAANTGPNVGPGAITPAGIRDSQRLWLRYRDAFVAFARAAAPNLSPDAVLARLTAVRTRQLKALSDAG